MKIIIDGKAVEIPSGGGASGGVTMDQVNEAIDTKLDAYTPQEVYSTEETRIGTWIDGKPIYRQILSGTTPASGAIAAVSEPIQDIDTVVHLFTVTNASKYNRWYGGTTGSDMYFINTLDGRLYFYGGNGTYVNSKFHAIVEYTKTTDSAAEEA